MSEPTPTAENAAAPRRRGRRARALTPEEQAEMDARRAEFERQQALEAERREAGLAVARGEDPGAERAVEEDAEEEAPADGEERPAEADGSSEESAEKSDLAEQAERADDDASHGTETEHDPVTEQVPETEHGHPEAHEHHHRADVDPLGEPAAAHGPSDAAAPEGDGDARDAWAAPAVPAEPVQPSVRRLGKRARVVELDPERTDPTTRVPDHRAAASGVPAHGGPHTIPTDADGVELGEIPVGEHPDPRPAPRFEGRVLHRADRSGGNPVVWVVWAVVVLAIIALVVLLATGTLGGGSDGAMAALPAHVLTSLTTTALEGAPSA